MKKFSIGNYLTPYLLAACVLLTGVLTMQIHNIVQAKNDISPEARPAIEQVTRESFAAPGIAAFSEIMERPLFIAGREPPPEPVAVQGVSGRLSPLLLRLEGVAITPAARIAVVRDLSSKKMLQLATGMKHQGWELTAISDNAATFRRGDESHELTLKIDRHTRR